MSKALSHARNFSADIASAADEVDQTRRTPSDLMGKID